MKWHDIEDRDKKKLLGLVLSLVTGVVLLARGLKFTFFGLFLVFGRPLSGLFLMILGLFGIFIIAGALLIWKERPLLGSTFVIVFSLLSVLKGFSVFIISGTIGGSLCLVGEIRDLEKEKMITLAVIFILSSTVFLSGLIHYRRLSSEHRYIEIDGTERKYLIDFPSGYEEGEPHPLIVALHGGGGSARSFRQKTNFDEIAERENVIVVYPDGTGANDHHLHTWNTGITNNRANKTGAEDVKFLRQLIEHLKKRYSIDESSIYMTGHSNGGRMTYRFAAEHPETLDCIAPVSISIGVRKDGTNFTVPEPERPLSVVHVHGREDEHVLYEGGEGKTVGGSRYDLSVNRTIKFWVENNNCSKTPKVERSEDGRIEVKRYENGTDNRGVTLVTLNRVGHFWNDMNGEVKRTKQYGTSLAGFLYSCLHE